MLSRRFVFALWTLVAVAGCATMTPEEAARAKALNDWGDDQAQQAGQLAAQQANQVMLMNQAALMNATLVQPPSPVPLPPP